MKAPKSQIDRSHEIFDIVMAELNARPEVAVHTLARKAKCDPKNLSRVRWLYNIRLAAGKDSRRISAIKRRRVLHWRLLEKPRDFDAVAATILPTIIPAAA